MSEVNSEQVSSSIVTSNSNNTRRPLLARLVILAGTIAAAGSVLSIFASVHWIPDILSQLVVQYLVLMFPAAILAWYRKRKWIFVLLVILMGVHVFKIAPYFRPPVDGLAKDSGATSYRLAVFNVLRTNEEFQKTLDSILQTEADVIYLMEVQPAWEPFLLGIKDRYPHQKILDEPDYTGVALLSRHPWRHLEVVKLGHVSNPSIDTWIQFDSDPNQEVHLIATHPLPPFGDALTRSRDQQMKTLIDRFKEDEAKLLCGDFNLSPWSPRFAAICQHGSLVDASLGFGLAPTLIPLPTPLGGIRVDHILRNEAIRVHDYGVIRTGTSDHGIVILDFSIKRTE